MTNRWSRSLLPSCQIAAVVPWAMNRLSTTYAEPRWQTKSTHPSNVQPAWYVRPVKAFQRLSVSPPSERTSAWRSAIRVAPPPPKQPER